MQSQPIQVAVVGGGASGMMAAIAAARGGAEVVILERMSRVGKKLLATGNGRCNLSNLDCGRLRYHGTDPRFALAPLARFGPDATLRFFEELGIPTRVEEEGRIYPLSGQASSVLDVLRYELERLRVRMELDADIGRIGRGRNRFSLSGKNGRSIDAGRVILAAGGMASPQLGSDGSGHRLAASLGHAVVDPFPALVQLRLNARFLSRLKGVKFIGAADILDGDRTVRHETGEILFTDYGISGPPILQISRKAAELLRRGKKANLALDLFPTWDLGRLGEVLRGRRAALGDRTVEFGLVGFLNKRLIPVILAESGVRDAGVRFRDLPDDRLDAIASTLKHWRMEVSGSLSWTQAQVTAGGVDTREVNPETLQSKMIPGLYFCGEILDVDGDSGGFNLQWAWSSGFVAGTHAGRRSHEP